MSQADHRRETAARFKVIRKEYKQKLDPQDYPGQISLVFELDTDVCIITGEGETVIGELSSYDAFGNVILRRARCRIFGPAGIQDIPYGDCYFRAERVMLIGQIDKEKNAQVFPQASAPDDP
jgi:U6 snRNA-associated Sm-like protein LSm1